MQALLGEEAEDLLRALEESSPISIRLNPLKPAVIAGGPIPWCANGRYLNERPVFTLDPLLHAGCYYVQEASSMLLEQAVLTTRRVNEDLLALDMCAAPGGKSTHLASLLSSSSLIVMNEPVPKRHAALTENVWKHGAPNTMITKAQPRDFSGLGELFDLIVVDAPCSGEGMFRKDPFAREQWNEQLVRQCSATQRDILHHAWASLKPGGHLLYSTCTWESEENEEQVRILIAQGATVVPMSIDPTWGVVNSDPGYRCYPHKVKGEGLFIALLQKPGSWSSHAPDKVEGSPPMPVSSWLKEAEHFDVSTYEEELYASPSRWRTIARLLRSLPSIAPGIPVAIRKGNEWRPHAALALNAALNTSAFEPLAADREEALRYLRGETLNGSEAQGVRLVTYEGHALGWVSGARDRWNNGWPKPWRIRLR